MSLIRVTVCGSREFRPHVIERQVVAVDEIVDRSIELENLFRCDVSKAAVRTVDAAGKQFHKLLFEPKCVDLVIGNDDVEIKCVIDCGA